MAHDRAYEILDIWLEPYWHRSVLYAVTDGRPNNSRLRLVGAIIGGMVRELRRCLEDADNGVVRAPIKQLPNLLRKWTSPEDIRLAAGEVSVEDMKIVLAATSTLADDIRAVAADVLQEPEIVALKP